MIIVKLYGGIGNQMFQYATAKSLAIRNNSELKLDLTHYQIKVLPHGLPYRTYDLEILNITSNIASAEEMSLFKVINPNIVTKTINKIKNIIKPVYVIHEPYFHFYPKLLNLKGNIYLDGYWQTEKYFSEIKTVIKNEFQIKHTLNAGGFEMLDKIHNSESVCLNIRRKEFATNPHLNLFTGIEYILKSIEYMNNKLNNPHYFIFSDELDWVKANLPVNSNFTFVGNHLYGEKFKDCLYLMTNCKHFIIPNSSFGWWAAWLANNNNKIVVAPKKWFNDKSINTNDILPDNWIKI